MIDWVHEALKQWGRWVRQQDRVDLGYPHTAPIYRMMQHARQDGPVVYEMSQRHEPHDASAMNRQIQSLPNPDQRILRGFYVEHGSPKDRAVKLKIPLSTLYHNLHRIHVQLEYRNRRSYTGT